ncbi:MAG: type VI secretion system tip protein TssI/VgrG [Dongiaceae bacterium]
MADVVLKQTNRSIVVDSPLGADALIGTYFDGEESLSQLFCYRLELLSNKVIQPRDILGKGITVELQNLEGTKEKKRRLFHGIVVRFSPGPMWRNGYRTFHAELMPWTWFLTRTTDCRIFENQKAPDIIKTIFQDLGFSDFEMRITEQHPTREYCVQFRETDFSFVSRLMEEEGIFYFFKHEKGKHTMVLADNKSAYLDCDDKEVAYTSHPTVKSHIARWHPAYSYKTGKWAQRDYNFKTPKDKLETTKNTLLDTQKAQNFEFYDFPGIYTKKGDGEELTKLRMEEEEAGYHRVEGESDCRSFLPGYKFKLTQHDCKDEENKTYVLTSVHHTANDHSHFTDEGTGQEYRNSFTCIPESVVYRPPRTTQKPLVYGLQTAVVTGPAGEDIHTDDDGYGRVRVHFHWEREGKDSMWARVAQSWAGKKWGTQFLPRVGMEVVVDFLEGDPDRPLIVGCVYNADNMPPYPLPGNKTQSGWKTRSTTGGGESDFNELRFEDKKGSEEVYFHAQKDFKRKVEHDDTLEVDNDQTRTITNNRTTTIDRGDDKFTMKMGSQTNTFDMGGQTNKFKMGNRDTKLDLGKDAVEAMQSIEFKVGQSSVKIDQMGVTIKGMMIKIEGTMMTDVQGMMTTVKGNAMLTLSGGVLMIG